MKEDTFINEKHKGYKHRWSGWPGAFCLKCGVEDLMEVAIGCSYYDPFTDTWKSEELKKEFTQKPCPCEE